MQKKQSFLLLFLFFINLTIQAQWVQIGQDIDGEAAFDNSGNSVSISSDGSVVAIGAFNNDGNGNATGHVRIYKNTDGTWIQVGADIDGEAAGDRSGRSVSLSSDGSIVAIGAAGNAGNGSFAGHVRIYKNSNNTWSQVGADIDGELAGDYSGYSVSISSNGSIVAIGAIYNDDNGENAGQVRIFEIISGAWTQLGEDIYGEAARDESGKSVSLSADGSIVAIGAPNNDENGINAGHVRIYENLSGNWTQIGTDIDGETEADYSYRLSLNADGSIVAIGATGNSGNGYLSGHVRVYKNIGGIWSQIGEDIDGEAEYDTSGGSVNLNSDGSVVAIGATGNAGNGTTSGHVRIYQNNNDIWTQIGEDIDGEVAGDLSGGAVCLSSNGAIVAIGAGSNDGNGTDSGHVRVYSNPYLGISELSDQGLSVYPNPTTGYLILKSSKFKVQSISLFDITGKKLVIKQQATMNNSIQIDITAIENGVYFLKIKAADSVFTTQIIKNSKI